MATADKKKISDKIQCMVVTPEKTVLDEVIDFVAVPLFDGELGILPGRAPLVGRLGFGEMRIIHQGATRRFYLDGGFAQVRDDVVTILTNRAVAADKIDAAKAAAELEQARSMTPGSEVEQAQKSQAIDRARALVRVAAKR